MVNALNWTDLTSFSLSGDSVELEHRLWLAASFAVLVIGLVASLWVGIQIYLVPGDNELIGIALIVQNVLIFVS